MKYVSIPRNARHVHVSSLLNLMLDEPMNASYASCKVLGDLFERRNVIFLCHLVNVRYFKNC